MPYAPINLAEKLARLHEQWSPRIIAQMNDYHTPHFTAPCARSPSMVAAS